MKKIRAIIFDYGGVIGNNPNDYIYKAVSKEFRIDRDEIKKEFFKFIFDLEKGKITERFFWRKIAKNLSIINYVKLRNVWLEEYKKRAKMNKKVLDLIRQLKNNYKLCLLSNNAIFFQTPDSSKILKELFDLLIYSFDVKMRKPEKEIYEYTLTKLRLKPAECIIIDDDIKKLNYPKKIGMQLLHFKTFFKFKKDLNNKLNIESAKKAWDKAFKKEGKIFIEPQKDMEKIVKFFKKEGVRKILDLGCGSGRHLVYLTKQGFDVYGIDIATHGIKIAKAWLKKEELKANLEIGDIYKKLPYEDNFFDAIISTRTLHHGKIEDIRKLIKEMKRILKPRGLIFITVRKEVAKKYIPKEKLFGIKFIAPRTYIILGGPDKGMPHYKFNKQILKKEFKKFKIIDLYVEPEGYYCLIGRLSNKDFLDNLDIGDRIADFSWLRKQAKDKKSKELISKTKEWYEDAYMGKYQTNKQLFFVKLKDYKIWLRKCSAHSSLDMYTDIFKYNRHFLLSEFLGNKAKIIIDGGASEGFYTLRIKQNNPSSKIITIEPNPLAYEILKKNVESNYLENVIVINKALAEKNKKIPFEYVEQISSIGGRNMQIIKRPWLKKNLIKKTEVECITLEKLCKECDVETIDILKLDIQGMEMEVLKSSKDFLNKIHRIIVEWHTPKLRSEIIKFLKKYGFDLIFEDKKPLGDLYFINKNFY